MKNKIKKLKLPLSKMTGEEKNYTAVLMEDVNSNLKFIGEVLHSVKERGDATFEQVGLLTEKVDILEAGQETINKRLYSIDFKLDNLTKEISFIKEEIKSLKTNLLEKADKEKLKILEFKIIRIESHLKLA